MFGGEKNPPIFVYDTSGPYTDPAAKIDIRSGLPPLREQWIAERGDTENSAGPELELRQRAAGRPEAGRAALQPEAQAAPRAKAGANVSQMHYARKGIITPEMEFIAIRENLQRDAYIESLKATGKTGEKMLELLMTQHPGESLRRGDSRSRSRRNSCATRWRAAAPSSRPTSTTRKPSR